MKSSIGLLVFPCALLIALNTNESNAHIVILLCVSGIILSFVLFPLCYYDFKEKKFTDDFIKGFNKTFVHKTTPKKPDKINT